MKTTYSARPGCTGAATHEPTCRAGQRKSIALQWIFTEILRFTGPVRVPRQTSRTARPGCPGVTNDNRIVRPGSTAGQPGRATRLVYRRLYCCTTATSLTLFHTSLSALERVRRKRLSAALVCRRTARQLASNHGIAFFGLLCTFTTGQSLSSRPVRTS